MPGKDPKAPPMIPASLDSNKFWQVTASDKSTCWPFQTDRFERFFALYICLYTYVTICAIFCNLAFIKLELEKRNKRAKREWSTKATCAQPTQPSHVDYSSLEQSRNWQSFGRAAGARGSIGAIEELARLGEPCSLWSLGEITHWNHIETHRNCAEFSETFQRCATYAIGIYWQWKTSSSWNRTGGQIWTGQKDTKSSSLQ